MGGGEPPISIASPLRTPLIVRLRAAIRPSPSWVRLSQTLCKDSLTEEWASTPYGE